MELPNNLTVEDVCEAVDEAEHVGFCIWCGHRHSGIDPDAEKDLCEECGGLSVYGAERILIAIL